MLLSFSSWKPTTESMMSPTTSSLLDSSDVISDIINTPLPTSKTSTDFFYVDYSDYRELFVFEEPSSPSGVIPGTTSPATTRRPRRSALPYLFKQKTPIMHLVPALMVTQHQTPAPTRAPATPEFLTTTSPNVGDIIITKASEEGSSSLSVLVSEKNNNSVDEVQYHIVGMDSESSRKQQNYFVLQIPPLRERTQNKRIQQLLKEKQLQNLRSRVSKPWVTRTGRNHWTHRYYVLICRSTKNSETGWGNLHLLSSWPPELVPVERKTRTWSSEQTLVFRELLLCSGFHIHHMCTN